MLLQERSPHQDISNLGLLSDVRGVGLSRPDGAEPAPALIDGPGRDTGRRLVANRVEDVLEPRSRLLDRLDNIRVAVVESVCRPEALDKVEVTWAAGSEDFEPMQRRNLDGVKANAGYDGCQLWFRSELFGLDLQLPPQIRTEVSDPESLGIFRQS